jgi:hypothetical protein
MHAKADVRLHLIHAEEAHHARAEAERQHQIFTESPPDAAVCQEASSCPTYGKLKIFAVATTTLSRIAEGRPLTTLTVVEAHSREIAERNVRQALKQTGGDPPDHVDLLEIPKPCPHPPMAEWVKAACIDPHVGAPLLAGSLRLLCRIAGERAIPVESLFGEGPMARIYAGLQMVERAWHELPMHQPTDPHADVTDGH